MNADFAALAKRFPRKRAFVTGAGSGLGRAFARLLANSGWSLGLFDASAEHLVAAESEFSLPEIQVQAFPGDVTQSDELTVAVNSFAQTVDGLDLMINNAGVVAAGGIMEVPLEDWRWVIDINLMGVIHGCRAAIPHLQRSRNGLLLNIASAAAFASAPGMIAYNATKAGVLSVSETLAMELADSGIQVSVAMPGFFRSGLPATARAPEHIMARMRNAVESAPVSAEEIAAEILLQASASKTYIVLPKDYRALWRLKRWLPARYLKKFPQIRQRQMEAAQKK
jgi:NAD(P)-dependent dehydrogenase (short-subunit alcohol dehydrogenase family)